MSILQALQKVSMTFEILKETKVGITVNKCKKKHLANNNINAICKSLIDEWKKVANQPSLTIASSRKSLKLTDSTSQTTSSKTMETIIPSTSSTESKRTTNRIVKQPSRLINEQQSILTDTQLVKVAKISSKTIQLLPSKPLPKRDASTGELIFQDYPAFRPNLTPQEVLQVRHFQEMLDIMFKPSYVLNIIIIITCNTDGQFWWNIFPSNIFIGHTRKLQRLLARIPL